MPVCSLYEQMTHREKTEFVGKLLHACQSSNLLLKEAQKLIKIAEESGLLDDVIILPVGEDTREPETKIENL